MNTEQLRTLLQQALQGQVKAFGQFYEHMLEPVYRFVYYRVRNPEDAEDLTETVFLKAWEALQRTRQIPENPRAWIYRIARNLIIDHYRTRRDHAPLEAGLHLEADSPEHTLLDQEETERVRRWLHTLPPLYQEVLILRFFLGLSHREVGEILGIRENHARLLQYRALKRLREAMQQDEE